MFLLQTSWVCYLSWQLWQAANGFEPEHWPVHPQTLEAVVQNIYHTMLSAFSFLPLKPSAINAALTTLGPSRLWTKGMIDLRVHDIDNWTGDAKWSMVVFLYPRIPRQESCPLPFDFSRMRWVIWTDLSAESLAWELYGLVVMCVKPHQPANCLYSWEAYCGPFSLMNGNKMSHKDWLSGSDSQIRCSFTLCLTLLLSCP